MMAYNANVCAVSQFKIMCVDPCVAVLNKQKYHFFFFYKIREQACGTVTACRFDTSGRGEEVGNR
jgi:hypothetical protein